MGNAGDVLARGGRKAQFPPAGINKTQKEWNEIFQEFDLCKYIGKEELKNGKKNSTIQT